MNRYYSEQITRKLRALMLHLEFMFLCQVKLYGVGSNWVMCQVAFPLLEYYMYERKLNGNFNNKTTGNHQQHGEPLCQE